MKIGVVRRGYTGAGGAEAYLLRFAQGLTATGHEAMLFTERWPQDAWPYARVIIRSNSPRTFADAFQKCAQTGDCDLIYSLERVWSCDAYRAGDGVHAAWLAQRARFEPVWKSWLRRWNPKHLEMLALERHLFSAQGAKVIIANSQMVKDEIARYFQYPGEKIRVVHNGAPPFTQPPGARADVRQQIGLEESDYVLLFAGSGWERKGLRFAIEAVNAAKSPRLKLLVAGRGNPRGQPESSSVCYLGAVTDMPRYLAAADAFILPTIYEPFSNACLEALAAGLPVITTIHNGFAEIIESGVEGEAVQEANDIDALATAIQRWEDPERRGLIRPRLQEIASRFSIEENVKQTLSIIAATYAP